MANAVETGQNPRRTMYNQSMFFGMPTQSFGRMPWRSGRDLTTVVELASAFGLRYESRVRPEDMTMARLRNAYARHGHFRHAARIIDLELSRHGPDMSPTERTDLLTLKAGWLQRVGDKDAAGAVVAEIESFWRGQADRRPADPAVHRRLAAIYGSPAYGKNHEKAREALRAAKRLDPGVDSVDLQEAGYLFELGRHEESWVLFDKALAIGQMGEQGATHLYQAGLSGLKTGNTPVAMGLLRQALWRDPEHKLADQAREAIHD